MLGAFELFLVSVCLVGQSSASPTVTQKHRYHSKVGPKEAPTTMQPQSSASLYARLKNRIHNYAISKTAAGRDQTTTSTTVIIENYTNVSTTSAPVDNQTSTSPSVTLKDHSDVTTTKAPDENIQQSTEAPFVTFKYQDYHAPGAVKAAHNDSLISAAAAAIRGDPHLLNLFQQILDLELDIKLPEYIEGHLVNSSYFTFNY